jgi:tetratricopeptide (TPR) repeat protein
VKRALIALVVAGLAAGCAYYNGLFNANRLANEARRAEREGRTSEARSLWSRAAVKAESVVARFPKSRYRDDAWLLQGQALYHLGTCTPALAPLRAAGDSSPDPRLRREARLLLGRCWLDLGAPDSAVTALGVVADSADPDARREARLLRGQARLRLGDAEGALGDLEESGDPAARFPRAMALVALGRVAAATDLLAGALDSPYVETGWLPALDSLGRRAPTAAADLVDRLTTGDRLRPGHRARLLLADGERWQAAGELERARARFATVTAAVPDSAEGRVARVYLTLEAVRRADSLGSFAPLLDSLRAATRAGGLPVRAAGSFLGVMTRTEAALADSSAVLALFLVAEEVRDSLGAPRLAATLFDEIVRRYPQSVLAPKALLALAALRPEQSDALIARLNAEYPESVYTLALRGAAGDRYRAVEESLRVQVRDPRQEATPTRRRARD